MFGNKKLRKELLELKERVASLEGESGGVNYLNQKITGLEVAVKRIDRAQMVDEQEKFKELLSKEENKRKSIILVLVNPEYEYLAPKRTLKSLLIENKMVKESIRFIITNEVRKYEIVSRD